MTTRHRLALAAATVAATTGLMLLALPLIPAVDAHIDSAVMAEMGMVPELPIPPRIHYGAIAYAPTGEWGKARRYLTRARADEVALDQCGVDTCKVLISFKRCGAVAYNGATYQGGGGITLSEAMQDAIDKLGDGRIVNWACN
ncbi:DUF4189 domain-containing protein [Mycobacterium kansasii]|uniref:DUF4189 domain-containing protein n=1 Tax=Mycobacterium pseudokansasii TaxID=2341080 RepID=A0A498QSK6_9MYCO|nr:hypothetical protein LAUMK35_02425 [Mycobacterium pseudokansasii]VAZ94814.1 hypothetical protein LAUMK21_02426 [Mycobacterium pseudokansasii]VBA50010.1 hypothetical protein LAUMK142_02319 [Mycobacterium pseudokansasii]